MNMEMITGAFSPIGGLVYLRLLDDNISNGVGILVGLTLIMEQTRWERELIIL